jgi:hypothetical protein
LTNTAQLEALRDFLEEAITASGDLSVDRPLHDIDKKSDDEWLPPPGHENESDNELQSVIPIGARPDFVGSGAHKDAPNLPMPKLNA